MSFDLRPYYHIDWAAESQLVEGGVNKFNNCLPTSCSIALQAEGFADIEPQVWTDFEYGGKYTGGEDFGHATDFMHKKFPNLPEIRMSNPRDTLGAIDAAGKQGFPVVLQTHCDNQGSFVDRYTGLFHMSIPVAWDGANLVIRNVWWGKEHTLPAAFVRKMTFDPAGWMMVFARSIIPKPAPPVVPVVPPDPLAALTAERDALKTQVADLTKARDDYKAMWVTARAQIAAAVKELST